MIIDNDNYQNDDDDDDNDKDIDNDNSNIDGLTTSMICWRVKPNVRFTASASFITFIIIMLDEI